MPLVLIDPLPCAMCVCDAIDGAHQVPTALEASGAIQPGDSIVSVNGIPLPGAGCYRRDAALLEAPGVSH